MEVRPMNRDTAKKEKEGGGRKEEEERGCVTGCSRSRYKHQKT